MSKHAPGPSRMTEEEYLHEQLRLLQMSYEKAAKPIVDRLVRIESLRCIVKNEFNRGALWAEKVLKEKNT